MKIDSINVALRVRKLIQSEIDRNCRHIIERGVGDGSKQIILNRTDTFTFNHVFDGSESQHEFYTECVMPRLDKILCGYNVTIFAYGQTGSGKTYTMGTAVPEDDAITIDAHTGVLPRAMNDLFKRLHSMGSDKEFSAKCSFVELYKEQFFDLLSTTSSSSSSSSRQDNNIIELREINKTIVMPGLTEIDVYNADDVLNQLKYGSQHRATAPTKMNSQSSRSHAIFTVNIVLRNKIDNSVNKSRFILVDLAGSERCSKTQATGDRFKEGVNINLSLFALGNVINALGAGQAVSYRQSKLTRLLQDSLGGNSISLMIACVSPADYNASETLSTLRYADRALKIKNEPIVNTDPHALEINHLKGIIKKLTAELLKYGASPDAIQEVSSSSNSNNTSSSGSGSRPSATDQEKQQQQEREQEQLKVEAAYEAHESLLSQLEKIKEMTMSQQLINDKDEVVKLVDSIIEEQQNALLQLQPPQRSSINYNNNNNNNANNMSSEVDVDEHINKQMEMNVQLRCLKKELDAKEELHQQMFNTLQMEDNESACKEQRLKINKLEREEQELLEQMQRADKDKEKDKEKTKETTSRLAEERRQKLNAITKELTALRQKYAQQAALREKQTIKIQTLDTEIRAIKESKVKLVRAMRQDAQKFQQWKNGSDKQLTQLQSKDRKMQVEMVRKEMLYNKQNQALKRKCEETVAINKRLKEALDRQNAGQQLRQTNNNKLVGKSNSDNSFEQELDVILSAIDAEEYLIQLNNERNMLNNRLSELQPADDNVDLIVSLRADVELRNTQIEDLEERVRSSNLEKRIQAVGRTFQTMTEGRAFNAKLMQVLVKVRREYAQQSNELRNWQNEQRAITEYAETLEHRLVEKEKKKFPPTIIDTNTNTNDNDNDNNDDDIIDIDNDNDVDDDKDLDLNDPDWVPKKRKRSTKGSRNNSNTVESSKEPNGSPSEIQNGSSDLREIKLKCKCKKNCKTKRCICFQNGLSCSAACICKSMCANPFHKKEKDDNNADNADNADNANVTENENENESENVVRINQLTPTKIEDNTLVEFKKNSTPKVEKFPSFKIDE